MNRDYRNTARTDGHERQVPRTGHSRRIRLTGFMMVCLLAISVSAAGTALADTRPGRLKAHTRGWDTNWDKRTIEYDELQMGGPPRDGIPSIDDPGFVSTGKAKEWLADNEPVIFLSIEDDARAYPLQILVWHEIVNDTVGGEPVLVTFCPLCNASLVFDRRVMGKPVEFGTSGLLRNSDLVMYDRATESLWQQLTGEAIVGDLAGKELRFVPSAIIGFGEFRANHPDGRVLSRDTGYNRAYGSNPYVGYDHIGQSPFLFRGELDPRLQPMERVVAVELETTGDEEKSVAYPVSVLSDRGVLNDSREEARLALFHQPGASSALDTSRISSGRDIGSIAVYRARAGGRDLTFEKKGPLWVDRQTGSRWNLFGEAVSGPLAGASLEPVVHGTFFWFAWVAFKPDTQVYENS